MFQMVEDCLKGSWWLRAAPVCDAGDVEGRFLLIHCVLERRMAECSLSRIATSVQILIPIKVQNGEV